MLYKNIFGPTPNCPLATSVNPGTNYGFLSVGGPCSFESEEQLILIFNKIKDHITFFRGGVFRAGTYPGKSWGWQWDLLKCGHDIAVKNGKKNVVDVLDIRDIEKIEPYTEVFQVGTRQAQHYALLEELGRQKKPVIIKRGTWQKLGELMGSLEYVLKGGNDNVILCERGSVSYLDHIRWELSVSMISMIKEITKFPVIVDASHGSGNSKIVQKLTLAGIAAGADGCLIETHYDPEKSMSDAEQAISIDNFIVTIEKSKQIKAIQQDNRF